MTCPTEFILAQYADRELSGSEVLHVTAHLQNCEKCREDALDTAHVEVLQRKCLAIEILPNNAGDEKAGNYEEDIDANKAAGKAGKPGVIEDDGQNSDCP